MVRVRKCYVCDKNANKDTKTVLHAFPSPSNAVQFKNWIYVLGLFESDEVKNLQVCNGHFLPTDYVNNNFGGRLKPFAVPSLGVQNELMIEHSVVPAQSVPVPAINCEAGPSAVPDRMPWVTPTKGGSAITCMDISPLSKALDKNISDDEMNVGSRECGIGSTPTTPNRPVLSDCTNSTSFRTFAKGTANHSTPAWRRCTKPRYISELTSSDVATPRRAERTINFVKEAHGKKSQKVKRLYDEQRRLKVNNSALEKQVAHLQSLLDSNNRPEGSTSNGGEEVSVPRADEYNMGALKKDLQSGTLPEHWTLSSVKDTAFFFYFGDVTDSATGPAMTRSVCVTANMTVEVRARGKVYPLTDAHKIARKEDALALLKDISTLYLCTGVEHDNGICRGDGLFKERPRNGKCLQCTKQRRRSCQNDCQNIRRLNSQKAAMKRRKATLSRKMRRLQAKLDETLDDVEKLKAQCAAVQTATIEDALRNFPKLQQEAARACLNAAKCKGSRGRRYTNAWILECLMLRIKSRKAYLHIRNHNILPVPTLSTLNKYIEKLEPSYGFSKETFEMLKAKAATMKPEERRGTLVLDEMKVSEAIAFDKKNLLFKGFTDLGDYTPEEQMNSRGDHALVFLLQPFRGSWVQAVAAFLSKGCANSKVLHQLIMECIILLENAGFFVDVVTSDGATWNRSMWTLFGLTGNSNSCEHPLAVEGSDRRMWFCSDFHHLLKNFRNFLVADPETWTPSGVIKMSHFEAVLNNDNSNGCFGLRIAHRLTIEHLYPRNLRKMNVGLAIQLFHTQVAAAMLLGRMKDPDLSDCQPTVDLIKIVNKVVAAMSSKDQFTALSPGSEAAKIIEDFIGYLEDWQYLAAEGNHKFMSANTYQGLLVTLRTALDVSAFLIEHCKYEYLMTARLNQDALEGFFGMVRSACGSSDHPDAILFIQVYRLLSFYSLVKPPAGSNVEGVEIFETLLQLDKISNGEENVDEWDETLDIIVAKGPNSEEIHRAGDEHDYNVAGVNEVVQAYFAGFVARKTRKWTSCEECLNTLTKEKGDEPRDELIP